jgi:hypothetical protein
MKAALDVRTTNLIAFLVVVNVLAMYITAEVSRRRSGGPRKPTFSMSYVQFLIAHLPNGFKVWFIISSIVALGIVLFLSFMR